MKATLLAALALLACDPVDTVDSFVDGFQCPWIESSSHHAPEDKCMMVFGDRWARVRAAGSGDDCDTWRECIILAPGEGFDVGADNYDHNLGVAHWEEFDCSEPLECEP